VISVSTTRSPVISVSTTRSPVISVSTTWSPVISVSTTRTPVISVSTTRSHVISVYTTRSPVISVSATRSPVISVSVASSPVISWEAVQETSRSDFFSWKFKILCNRNYYYYYYYYYYLCACIELSVPLKVYFFCFKICEFLYRQRRQKIGCLIEINEDMTSECVHQSVNKFFFDFLLSNFHLFSSCMCSLKNSV
jgi:hypothetical protein